MLHTKRSDDRNFIAVRLLYVGFVNGGRSTCVANCHSHHAAGKYPTRQKINFISDEEVHN